MSAELIVTVIEGGTPVVDSRVIATHCEIQHESLYKLLNEHQTVIEQSFGILRFQIGVSSKVGQPPKFALLTEEQSAFLITLTRNTPPVIKFKAALVKAFYLARNKSTIPQTLAEALRLAADQAEAVEKLQAEKKLLLDENETMAPKVAFFDCAMTSRDTLLVRDVAKLLNPDVPGGIGEKRLFAWLRENKWIYGDNRPYQTKIDAGYLRTSERPIPTNNHGTFIKITVRVTQRGLVALRKKLTEVAV